MRIKLSNQIPHTPISITLHARPLNFILFNIISLFYPITKFRNTIAPLIFLGFHTCICPDPPTRSPFSVESSIIIRRKPGLNVFSQMGIDGACYCIIYIRHLQPNTSPPIPITLHARPLNFIFFNIISLFYSITKFRNTIVPLIFLGFHTCICPDPPTRSPFSVESSIIIRRKPGLNVFSQMGIDGACYCIIYIRHLQPNTSPPIPITLHARPLNFIFFNIISLFYPITKFRNTIVPLIFLESRTILFFRRPLNNLINDFSNAS